MVRARSLTRAWSAGLILASGVLLFHRKKTAFVLHVWQSLDSKSEDYGSTDCSPLFCLRPHQHPEYFPLSQILCTNSSRTPATQSSVSLYLCFLMRRWVYYPLCDMSDYVKLDDVRGLGYPVSVSSIIVGCNTYYLVFSSLQPPH